jgi:hypothetical protein
MLELYAIWITLPALLARIVRRRALWRGFVWMSVLLVAAIVVIQDSTTNKDRATYGFLVEIIENDNTFSMEPGFYLLVRLLGLVLTGANLQIVFFFCVASISIAIKLHLFRSYGISMFGCLAAFFSYFFLLQEVTQIRSGLAIGFLYMSWFAFAEGRKRYFWLYGFAAAMFHFSCLLFILAPLLFAPRNKSKWVITVLVATGIAAVSALAGSTTLLALDIIAQAVGIERLSIYLMMLDDGILTQISAVRLVPHLLLLIAAALVWRRWRRDRLTLFVVQIYLYGPIIFIMLSPIPVLAYRVSDLFLFSGIFLIGRIRACVSRNYYYPLVVAYTAIFLVYTIQFSGLFMTVD